MSVVLDHPVGVFGSGAVSPGGLRRSGATWVRKMHPRAVIPAEEGRPGRGLALDVIDGGGRRLVVDRLHALLGQGARVFDDLLADASETRVYRRVVAVGRLALEHAARDQTAA